MFSVGDKPRLDEIDFYFTSILLYYLVFTYLYIIIKYHNIKINNKIHLYNIQTYYIYIIYTYKTIYYMYILCTKYMVSQCVCLF